MLCKYNSGNMYLLSHLFIAVKIPLAVMWEEILISYDC